MIVSWVAIADTAMLVYASGDGVGVCGPQSGCGAVINSGYATLFGVPLSTLGSLLAAFMAAASSAIIATSAARARRIACLLCVTTAAASLYAIYLQFVEVTVLHATCPFCMTLAASIVLICGLAKCIATRFERGETIEMTGGSLALFTAVPPGLIVVATAVVLLTRGGHAPPLLVVDDRRFTEVDWLKETPGAEDVAHRMYALKLAWANAKVLELATEREAKRRAISVAALNSELDARAADQRRSSRPLETADEESPYERVTNARIGALGSPYAALAARARLELSPPAVLNVDASRVATARGPMEARVEVVEVFDYECPFCVRAAGYLDDLYERFAGAVRIVYMHNPLPGHRQAELAAQAAECARSLGRFWEYHKALVKHSPRLDREHLVSYAADCGLDPKEFDEMLKRGVGEPEVSRQRAELAKHHVHMTPLFLVNGVVTRGTYPSLVAAVEEALRRGGR